MNLFSNKRRKKNYLEKCKQLQATKVRKRREPGEQDDTEREIGSVKERHEAEAWRRKILRTRESATKRTQNKTKLGSSKNKALVLKNHLNLKDRISSIGSLSSVAQKIFITMPSHATPFLILEIMKMSSESCS